MKIAKEVSLGRKMKIIGVQMDSGRGRGVAVEGKITRGDETGNRNSSTWHKLIINYPSSGGAGELRIINYSLPITVFFFLRSLIKTKVMAAVAKMRTISLQGITQKKMVAETIWPAVP